MGCALLIEQSNAFSGVAAVPGQLAPDACEGVMAIGGAPLGGLYPLSAAERRKLNTLKSKWIRGHPLDHSGPGPVLA